MLDLTHIIIAFQRNHPEFSYEDIEILCQDFLASQKKVKKEATKIKQLIGYLSKDFDADMSSIDLATGWMTEHLPEI